ncbi:hypothetical protein [Spirosoma sp.]|uniref:hypothetical protein n=1 Tax=Spirosoma sp. TaxID=1899569 RepID=UPI0026258CF1|nr:hypothetical protein [Spirosoma sp.]MCX6217636.1 hypothetical protein [Spirosoma sp.]
MSIYRIDQADFRGVIVDINATDNIQCSRVQNDEHTDADQLWFFEPSQPLAENEMAGKSFSAGEITSGEIVVVKFDHSAAILPILQDLAIIYGNLVKAGK